MENTNDALLKAPAARRNGGHPHEQTPSVGRMIGKYRIVSKLGAGGMGGVYLAEDTSLDRKVAIKVINLPSTEPSARRDALERFKLEAQAIARISHPNVVTVYEFTEIEGEYLLVMEYLPGRTLRELIEGEKALPPDQVVRHANAILSGLDAIHRAGLIHRDLKPQNILLLNDGRLKILDLGLVKFTERKLDLTQFGVAMGSPLYMAPEQIMALTAVGAIDKRVDIYALGVVLFQLLTGKPPYRGTTPQQIMQQHVSSPVPVPVSPLGHVSPVLTAIIVKAMAKQAGERYQTAGEMRAALEHVPRARRKSTGPQQPMANAVAAATVSALAASKTAASPQERSPVSTFKSLPPLPPGQRRKTSSVPPPIPAKALRRKPRTNLASILIGPMVVVVALLVAGVAWMLRQASAERDAFVAKDASAETAAKSLEASHAPSAKAAPPPVVHTATEGCDAYAAGDPSRAIEILTTIGRESIDTEARFCLCASEHLLNDANADKDCAAYLRAPDRDSDKVFQIKMWYRKR